MCVFSTEPFARGPRAMPLQGFQRVSLCAGTCEQRPRHTYYMPCADPNRVIPKVCVCGPTMSDWVSN